MSRNTPANNTYIETLVEKLKDRIKGFTVLDRQGELIGEVKDLMLNANSQLSLVVSRLTSRQGSRLLLLVSKLIQKIEPQNKAIFVDMNKEEMENLPEYETAETLQKAISVPAIPELEVSEEEIVHLLEERLVIDRHKRKVGEVVVRKEIETSIVQVPVRREKLIVEQVSPEYRQLAEIDLSQGEISGVELIKGVASLDIADTTSSSNELTVRGEFDSPKTASLLLNAIALERRHACKKVRIQIVVEDIERQKTYQDWFDRCSESKSTPSKL
jgi:hypothetical protein